MRFYAFLLIFLLPQFAYSRSFEYGGYFRLSGSSSFYEKNHILGKKGLDHPFFDSSSNLRLNTELSFSEKLFLNIDYESGLSGGDTKNRISRLGNRANVFFSNEDSDKEKFLNLYSKTESNDRKFFHRLDRLFLKYNWDFGSLSIGRQAVSTGSGLIFNPMDILNPFSPSDFIKDYKSGTDMGIFQFSNDFISDGTIIYVPRRNEKGVLDIGESSFAVKLKKFLNDIEAGIFYSRHYNDDVTGLSFSGFAGSGAWRSDLLWTRIDGKEQYGYFSYLINFDYSWVFKGKNWYGLAEYFYSGIGERNLDNSIKNNELQKRLKRGELFNTAQNYFGGKLQVELHPLINVYLTSIFNLDDYSYLAQPGITWSIKENLELLAGGDFPFGSENSEFKGVYYSKTGDFLENPVKIYMQVTFYF